MNYNQFSKLNLSPQAKIAIVVSRFNQQITQGLLKGAIMAILEVKDSLKQLPDSLDLHLEKALAQGEAQNISVFEVPGAAEIPLVAKKLAKTQKYQGIIALGCVIQGQTPHFDYICQIVSQGVLQASLETEVPISFGVITCKDHSQALARSGQDQHNKGREASLSLIELMEVVGSIS
jgi:6,7-dimethyl-8-ribityllumazine synthase